jgi:amino acid transporter
MDEWFFRFVIPESLHFLPHGTTGVLAALLLGTLNARGTEESGTFQLLVTGAKVAVLLAFIAGAFAFEGPTAAVGTFAARFTADAVGILTISALAFITFFGFSAIAASAGEIIEPRETVPKAIVASIITVTVLYALVIVAMVNSPIPAEVIAQEGETAMGRVASAFLGPIGQSLIVAGAIFSMVSASNASILAASGIGSLMGRQGQAPRRFSRIHPRFNTPFWSVTTATATIVALIVIFIAVFPAEGGLLPLELGLTTLTGFATLNLLLPLAIVNVALIYSRRRLPDIERGFRVPGVPVVPVVGILANIALISNLPVKGIVTGILLNVGLVGAYLWWGGAPRVEELFEEVVPPSGPTAAGGGNVDTEDRFQVLVAVARPDRAPRYAKLAGLLADVYDGDPLVRVVNVTHIPDQTPSEVVAETAQKRADRIGDLLAESDIDVEYTVEGHICRDVGFDIIQTARNHGTDRILMGYPEEHRDIAERVEYEAPCDVLFASGEVDPDDVSVVNVGAGGGPHHLGLLPLVNLLGERGSETNVISVTPTGGDGAESPDKTLAELSEVPSVQVHNVSATSVAGGLVSRAAENGGVLIIGATRDRRLRRWVLGSTPDRVIELAEGAGVPVLIYASSTGVSGYLEDTIYPVYRWLRRSVSGGPKTYDTEGSPTESR